MADAEGREGGRVQGRTEGRTNWTVSLLHVAFRRIIIRNSKLHSSSSIAIARQTRHLPPLPRSVPFDSQFESLALYPPIPQSHERTNAEDACIQSSPRQRERKTSDGKPISPHATTLPTIAIGGGFFAVLHRGTRRTHSVCLSLFCKHKRMGNEMKPNKNYRSLPCCHCKTNRTMYTNAWFVR